MKYTKLCFVFFLLIGLNACNDDVELLSPNKKSDAEFNLQSRDDCNGCEDIRDINLEIIDQGTDCCTYKLTFSNSYTSCHQVTLNGISQEIIGDDSTSELEIEVCSGDEIVLKILVLNSNTGNYHSCFQESLDCSCPCKMTIVAFDLPDDCCGYKIIVPFREACDQIVKIGTQIIPLNKSLSEIVSICSGEELEVQHIVNNEVCFQQVLGCGCDCDVLTDFQVIPINSSGTCCFFRVSASANSDTTCPHSVQIGSEIVQLNHGAVNQIVTVCESEEVVVSFLVNGIACREEILECNTCCADVETVFQSLGDTDEDGCCEFHYEIHNGDDCPKYLRNTKDNSTVAVIAPGIPFIEDYESCDGPIDVMYALYSESGEECMIFDFTNECDPICCEGVSMSAVLINEIGDVNCCKWEITIENTGDCPVYLFGLHPNPILTIPPNSIEQIDKKFCNIDFTFSVGPNENDPSVICDQVTLSCP